LGNFASARLDQKARALNLKARSLNPKARALNFKARPRGILLARAWIKKTP
jgi:hypothetical protein